MLSILVFYQRENGHEGEKYVDCQEITVLVNNIVYPELPEKLPFVLVFWLKCPDAISQIVIA